MPDSVPHLPRGSQRPNAGNEDSLHLASFHQGRLRPRDRILDHFPVGLRLTLHHQILNDPVHNGDDPGNNPGIDDFPPAHDIAGGEQVVRLVFGDFRFQSEVERNAGLLPSMAGKIATGLARGTTESECTYEACSC